METLDDAGVYVLSSDLAIIQTVDFFTPIVDDAYTFGQIAAANALSDVYAMGGTPITALNLLCFPLKTMGLSVMEDILRGGMDKIHEADVTLIGGHSVDDNELKYGLSVTGTVHPERMITNEGARPGDRLLLTKPLGTGIINTAGKAAVAPDHLIRRVAASMAALNRAASELMREAGAHACTDITGFWLLGHGAQMAGSSGIRLEFELAAIPRFPEVEGLARRGLCPGGLFRNKSYYGDRVDFAEGVADHVRNMLFDAQTSGGLLISIDAAGADTLLRRLHDAGIAEAAIVGRVLAEGPGRISVR